MVIVHSSDAAMANFVSFPSLDIHSEHVGMDWQANGGCERSDVMRRR